MNFTNRHEPPRTAPNRPESPRSDEQKRLRGTDQTATVHLEYLSDLIEPAFVEIDLKLGKARLIFGLRERDVEWFRIEEVQKD